MSTIEFQLPIAYLKNKCEVDVNLVSDLELLTSTDAENSEKSLYDFVFDSSSTVFSHLTVPMWARYYTSDKAYLKDTQTLISRDMATFDSSYSEMQNIWQEMQAETDFCEKYQYIDWKWLEHLNHSAIFLQILSLYNMSSPLFSLALPILLLIMPFFILRVQGREVSMDEYYTALKHVLRSHQLGQIFHISSASWDKRIYIIVTILFYVFQVSKTIL